MSFRRCATVAHLVQYPSSPDSELLGRGPPLAKYTPIETAAMPLQSIVLGHSPNRKKANNVDNAGMGVPKAAPPDG
jgi:hypothetical protein